VQWGEKQRGKRMWEKDKETVPLDKVKRDFAGGAKRKGVRTEKRKKHALQRGGSKKGLGEGFPRIAFRRFGGGAED